MNIKPKLELETIKTRGYNKIKHILNKLINVLKCELMRHTGTNDHTKVLTKYICIMELIIYLDKTTDEKFIHFVFKTNEIWNAKILYKCFQKKSKKIIQHIKLFLHLIKIVSYLIKNGV